MKGSNGLPVAVADREEIWQDTVSRRSPRHSNNIINSLIFILKLICTAYYYM